MTEGAHGKRDYAAFHALLGLLLCTCANDPGWVAGAAGQGGKADAAAIRYADAQLLGGQEAGLQQDADAGGGPGDARVQVAVDGWWGRRDSGPADGDGSDSGAADAAVDPDGLGPGTPCASGALVISEIMANPEVGSDRLAEWIELFNPSVDRSCDLQRCVLQDTGRDCHLIEQSLIIPPRSYVVLAASDDVTALGFVPEYVYRSVSLANGEDEILLVCEGVVIDQVAYGHSGLVPEAGASMSLDPRRANAEMNDEAGAWCTGSHVYQPMGASEGDMGTPGKSNPVCASSYPQ